MIVNTSLGYFFIGMMVLSFPISLIFLISNRNKIQSGDSGFVTTYGAIFSEFKNYKGIASIQFYSWFFLRRSLYIITIIVLRDYVLVQVIINI